jgi:carboxymethylenebutenolidase
MIRNIISQKTPLNVKDGSIMDAFVAMPDDKVKHPGILIFQEAFGVNAYIRDIAQRFAHLGFISIAPELFHRTAPGFEGNYNNFEGTKEHIQALTTEGLINDIEAAYLWLLNYPTMLNDNIASIGFCMGGRISFLANTAVKLKAAISFYGGGIPALLNRVEKIQAPLLLFWGGLDKHIDENQISLITESLKQNKINYVNVVFSEANHGFFCDARQSFNPQAAKNSWALVNSFLDTYLVLN